MTNPTAGPTSGAPTALTPAHLEWLSLIRYQARLAEEQSRAPLPLAILSISQMQDAAEALLNLIAEHNNIELKRRTDFDKLFDDVAGRFPALGHHRTPLLALNTARVGFKHHGNEVRQTTIERCRGNAIEFMIEATSVGLGQDFEAISMTAFVRDEEARQLVEEATSAWAAGDALRAGGTLRRAFDRLVRDYEMRKVWSTGYSVFSTEPHPRPFGLERRTGEKVQEHFLTWMQALDQQQRLLALGVDVLRYAYLNTHMPTIHFTADGRAHIAGDEELVTPESFQRCYRFVIDTALRLGAEDYDYDAYARLLAQAAGRSASTEA